MVLEGLGLALRLEALLQTLMSVNQWALASALVVMEPFEVAQGGGTGEVPVEVEFDAEIDVESAFADLFDMELVRTVKGTVETEHMAYTVKEFRLN